MNSVKSTLADRIYRAQSYGTIEPIEFMVPYPNLGSLVAGQNIKLADRIWYRPDQITYGDLLGRINQTANWLAGQGITNHDTVFLSACPTPQAEILAHAVWLVGAVVVLGADDKNIRKNCQPKLVIDSKINYPETCANYFTDYTPGHKALLSDDALLYWHGDRGIRLSHYNLLVNANGILSLIDPPEILQIDLPAVDPAWAVLQAILPLYAGSGFAGDSGGLHIGGDESADYQLNYNISDANAAHQLRIIPEASAVAQIGSQTLPLTTYEELPDGEIRLTGHMVMQGYTDDAINETVFTDDGLEL